MSAGHTPPQARRASRHWQRYRKHEQPLDGYEWTTSARLTGSPKGKGHSVESLYQRLLSFQRFNPAPNHQGAQEPSTETRTGSLRRILPYLRSLSEPGTGTGGGPERVGLRKVGSDTERHAPSIGGILTSFSRRISRVLGDPPAPGPGPHLDGGGASGRRMSNRPYPALGSCDQSCDL